MRVQINTLGCKMNTVDSERLAEKLAARGIDVVESDADVLVVNTCTVTNSADKKSAAAARHTNDTHLVLTGCSVRTAGDLWQKKFPEATLCADSDAILAWFKKNTPTTTAKKFVSNRTRKFIPIQTGCDTYCSYCIIPYARGKSRFKPADSIVEQIRAAESDGIREVVLTGINLMSWGCSDTRHPEESRFGELLAEILEKTTIPRIRISSIGPEFLRENFWDTWTNPRICDHLHISVQSGCDTTLARMNRGHGTAEITNLIARAKKIRPHAAFTADVIAGFPGETDTEWTTTVRQIEKWELTQLHVFPFSLRSGTAAEHLPNHVSEKIKKSRAAALRSVGKTLHKKWLEKQFGRKMEILWEKNGTGHSTNFVRVRGNGTPGSISSVTLLPEILWEKKFP